MGLDTALTRMYNQTSEPGKRLYKNPIDCLWKTAKIEGPMGLYVQASSWYFCSEEYGADGYNTPDTKARRRTFSG